MCCPVFRITGRWLGAAALLALIGGCRPDYAFPNGVSTTIEDVNRIQGDSTLTPQEKRAEFADLGFTPAEINFLMRDVRTANQFGGDLRTAYEKVAGEQLLDLTPDEIQIYADAATNEDDQISVTFDDEQALAIAAFFADNGFMSRDDLSTFLDDEGNLQSLPAGVTEEQLLDVFVDFDPDRLLDNLP